MIPNFFHYSPFRSILETHQSLKKVSQTILHLKLHLEGTGEDTRIKCYKIKEHDTMEFCFLGDPSSIAVEQDTIFIGGVLCCFCQHTV